MSTQAPAWAFTAEALDGVGDSHLPEGIHVRALPSPRLGLPATPLVVYRSVLDPVRIKRYAYTEGVVWIDSHGQTLSTPFNVTPDNPVYGYFPSTTVLWAELSAVPALSVPPFVPNPVRDLGELVRNAAPAPTPAPIPGREPPIASLPIPGRVAPAAPLPIPGRAAPAAPLPIPGRVAPTAPLPIPGRVAPAAPLPIPGRVAPAAPIGAVSSPLTPLAPSARARVIPPFRQPEEFTRFAETLPGVLESLIRRPASLRFEALANTALGPAPFQSRAAAPYVLAAWPIPLVRVVGRGTVRGIRWIDAERIQELQKEEFWEVWSLPVDPAPRYTPTPNAHSEAKERVERAGATHQPMYVAYTAASPSSAPPASPGDAQQRVEQVRADLDHWLEVLLHDLSQPTWNLVDEQNIEGRDGQVAVPIEPFLIAGAVDPDVGHWLGFGDVDQKPPAEAGSLVLYRVRGLWRWSAKRWSPPEAGSFAKAVRPDVEAAVAQFEELKRLEIVPREKGPFVDLHAMAVALVGTPPDVPPAVSFDAAEDRGWLATPPPPDVRRALRLKASGFRPHAVAALEATDVRGDRSLHPYPKMGRLPVGTPVPADMTPLPLVVSRPQDAVSPGEGRFEDRDAPEGSVVYRLAQGDWFGRWAPWVSRTAPAKARTAPMRPTLEIYPHAPSFGTPVPDGLLSGTIEIRIPIPRTDDLPAGGAALARLDLVESFEGSASTTTGYTLPSPSGATIEFHPAPQHDVLLINRTGPAMPRSGKKKVSYTARWIDVGGLVSPDAYPAARTMVDPRPPPLPPVITELRYTARPDAQGHARVDLDWTSTAGTRYRVFASNETTLLAALEAEGHHSAATAIRAAEPGAPRAMVFRTYKSLFGWDHFENVTKEPIVATGTSTHFVHRVSGSLEVLAIYRVISEGESGALAELTEAELVPFAVPNLGATARPQVAILNAGLDPTTQGVRLRVKVPAGKASPAAWRLRRSSVPVDDPLRMNLVASGTVSGAHVDGEGMTFEIDAPTPLLPWRQYRFAVEVQADEPPGAPTVGVVLPGEWSEASAPATLAVIPPGEPAAPSSAAIQNVAGALQITVTHPAASSLVGTALGPHRFEVWRVAPGSRPSRQEVSFSRGAGGTWVGSDPGTGAPGTYVTVRIIDPVGRRSDATASNQL